MPLHLNSPMPDFSGATEWIGEKPGIKDLMSAPVLIYFWSVSCHICHDNMPRLAQWREQYVPKGLKLVSIHAPRQEDDLDVAGVVAKKAEYHISEAVGVDNRHTVMQSFENELLPAYFLYDREGKLVRRAAGNAGLGMIEPVLQKLLAE
jgi:thiol-disulfide isomerase/thioredoxin